MSPRRAVESAGSRAEDGLVVGAVVRRDHVRVLLARAAVLDRALERAERLRPQAVLAAIPEQERAVRRAGDRHRAPVRDAHAVGQRRAVLELPLRHVAGRARDLAVGAQARVEEQLASELGGARVVRDAVGRIRAAPGQAREGRCCATAPTSSSVHRSPRGAAADAIVTTSSSANAIRALFVVVMAASYSARLKVTVSAPRGCVDGELELPPAAHVEAHAFDLVESVAERARHARPRRQAVAVLRHAAVNLDGGVVDRGAGCIGDGHAHGLHPAGAQRLIGLERRGELARRRRAGAGAELGRGGARDVAAVHHHHQVAAARDGDGGGDGQGQQRTRCESS